MQQILLTDALGYVAAGLVFATFCAQQMALLRALAIASNVAFIGYGFLDGLWPILILHSAMLPINIRRYRQSVRGHCNQSVSEHVASAQTDSLDSFYIEGITRRQGGKSCIPIGCTTSSML
jgi:hypothetical protein